MDHSDPLNYRFDDYLSALGYDWFSDDELLGKWLARHQLSDSAVGMVRDFGRRSATRYRDLAEQIERPENLPYLATEDPYNRHRKDVVLPVQTRQLLAEVHGSGIWRASLDDRARYAIVFLLSQNSEFGVLCSTACTDGMARALRQLGDDTRSRRVLERLEQATEESWIHGAQFVTEIQGGSDAATNQLQAEPIEDGLYALTGDKWFCSNLTADYWMITARLPGAPADHRGIGLFCVPRRWEHEPNGFVIHRLKDKVGTRALPTAEMSFERAKGWPIGPLDAGLKNMVAIVLTTSRIYNTIAAAAGQRRACREARAYAHFRRAFGHSLAAHPLLTASLERLEQSADFTQAGAFAVVDAWLAASQHPSDKAQKLWARVLISIAKAVTARRANAHVYEAMMVLGGNGIEERFCALPRLWRDSAILETWEGPFSLLLMQALTDLAKFGTAGREEAFLRFGLGDYAQSEHIGALAQILKAPEQPDNIIGWGELAPELYRCFEQQAFAEFSISCGKSSSGRSPK